jgi:hypothetical protein
MIPTADLDKGVRRKVRASTENRVPVFQLILSWLSGWTDNAFETSVTFVLRN